MIEKMKKYEFLFSELVKRDFKQKYKRTSLGMVWSLLNPLLQLLVYDLVFTQFFGRDTENYIIYVFSGVVVFNYFNESTKGGMTSLINNAKIFTKLNVPKYLFLFSKNVSALINYGLILLLYLIFCIIYGIDIGPRFLLLIYPSFWLMIFNLGMGLILSALFVFFRDIQYLYDIGVMLARYLSAIFYTITRFSDQQQRYFLLNPIYTYIKYFRMVVIDHTVPSFSFHCLCAGYALVVFVIGCWIYKRYNTEFLYYV
ncbi:MAG: ABC transporter permease [Dorea sp.]|nr:ABC transporter permease [Dorea sp.]